MAEMFPNLGEPLPHTVSPTTTTWNKVDMDIAQHSYNLHGDMISNLQADVNDLSTKVHQLQNDIHQLKIDQRTHHTTTNPSNHTVFTAKKNAVVRYYASPPTPTQAIISQKSKVVNPYMKKKIHVVNPYLKKRHHSKLATWPRK